MSIAKVTEVIASSPKSFGNTIASGVTGADKTLKNITGAWVKDQRVVVDKGAGTEYGVVMKVTGVLKDQANL